MESSSSSSSSSNYTLFPFIDISKIFLFVTLTCFETFKTFFSAYWSFPQSQHVSAKTLSTMEKPQKAPCSTHQVSSTMQEVDSVLVCRKDVENLMGNLGIFCSQEREELNESFGSDEVSGLFEEEPSLEELKEAFDVFDLNKDGFIDAEELQRVLCILGLKQGLKLENCHKMINHFDENRDGRIDFREFVKFMEHNFC